MEEERKKEEQQHIHTNLLLSATPFQNVTILIGWNNVFVQHRQICQDRNSAKNCGKGKELRKEQHSKRGKNLSLSNLVNRVPLWSAN